MRSYLLTCLVIVPTALAANNLRFMDLQPAGIMRRQTDEIGFTFSCGTGDTCQEACGPQGTWDLCAASNKCFNEAQICCTNGGPYLRERFHERADGVMLDICSKGFYCAGNGNCCREGEGPTNCGGFTSLAVVPGVERTTPATPSSAHSSVGTTFIPTADTTSSSQQQATYPLSISSYGASALPSSSQATFGTGSAPSMYPQPSPSNGNGTSPPFYPPAQQTTNDGVQGRANRWVLGGLAFLGLGFFF